MAAASVAALLGGCGGDDDAGGPNEGPLLVNISNNATNQASVFPQVWVNPNDPNTVAVAWRRYGLPIDTNADVDSRLADCHVAISRDNGSTFSDTNLMPTLRTRVDVGEPQPNLYFCNAPWVTFGTGSTVYAGGSAFTPLGTVGPLPKQGRVMFTVSKDVGNSWSPPNYGIKFKNFAPGLTGLNNSTLPENTPWDGGNGFADTSTGTFFTSSGSYVVASQDKGVNFGTVYSLNSAALPGWTVTTVGVMNASHGVLGAPFIATATPVAGGPCPCMGYATSTDFGKTWTARLVARAADFNASGDTARWPVSASDPTTAGRIAITGYTPDHTAVKVFTSDDNGATWKTSAPALPVVTTPIATASKTVVSFTPDGHLLVVWRGFQGAGSTGAFDTFAAALAKGSTAFGPTVRVSPKSSTYPTLTTQAGCDLIQNPQKACYGQTNGGGDFITWIAGNNRDAFVAFPYIPDGIEDTYLARIPMSSL